MEYGSGIRVVESGSGFSVPECVVVVLVVGFVVRVMGFVVGCVVTEWATTWMYVGWV